MLTGLLLLSSAIKGRIELWCDLFFFRKKQLIGLVYFSLTSLLLGCSGDVSRAFRIDQGIDPAYQDENVRFRTTYYFRVLALCPSNNNVSPATTSTRNLTEYFVNKAGPS